MYIPIPTHKISIQIMVQACLVHKKDPQKWRDSRKNCMSLLRSGRVIHRHHSQFRYCRHTSEWVNNDSKSGRFYNVYRLIILAQLNQLSHLITIWDYLEFFSCNVVWTSCLEIKMIVNNIVIYLRWSNKTISWWQCKLYDFLLIKISKEIFLENLLLLKPMIPTM